MRTYTIFLFLFTIAGSASKTQTLSLAPSVSIEKRTERDRLEKMILQNLQLPVIDSTLPLYQSAFWAMEYLQFNPVNVKQKIRFFLNDLHLFRPDFKNSLLELVYSNYPNDFVKEFLRLIKDSGLSSKQFAVCAEYLLRVHQKYNPIVDKYKENRLENKHEEEDMILFGLGKRYKTYTIAQKKELLQSILKNEFLQNKTILISLQNKNRDFPGIVIVRKSNGEILRFEDTIFYVPQLARAITNLPYYISNGNTPQGLFRIDGFAVSTNSFIGPTENFQLCMPFECPVKNFFDTPVTDTAWDNEKYSSLIPPKFSNSNYSFLYESAIAGKAGRYEIIAHGTTVPARYYQSKPYQGFTPTMGCLQTAETWNYDTGERTYSDQQKLIDAYKSTGAIKGYLLVLDIKNNKSKVTLHDLKTLIK